MQKDVSITWLIAKLANEKQIHDCMVDGIMITQSTLQKELRDNHLIHINITSSSLESYTLTITAHKSTGLNLTYDSLKFEDFDSYEEALHFGLMTALKLIK